MLHKNFFKNIEALHNPDIDFTGADTLLSHGWIVKNILDLLHLPEFRLLDCGALYAEILIKKDQNKYFVSPCENGLIVKRKKEKENGF